MVTTLLFHYFVTITIVAAISFYGLVTAEDVIDNEMEFDERKILSCTKLDYSGYNTIQKCCQLDVIENFDATALSAVCNNNNPIDLKYFTNFLVNSFQNPKNNYNLNFRKSKHGIGEQLAESACIARCNFNNVGLIKADGSVDETLLQVYFASLVPLAWKQTVKDGVMACKASIDLLTTVKVTKYEKSGPISCSVAPIMYIQCVQAYLIGRCPASLSLPNPDPLCEKYLEALAKCTRPLFGFPDPEPDSNSAGK